MKKLFYLLLALPLAFAACTDEPTPEPQPNPETEVTLEQDVIEATADGGRYKVNYTIENAVEGHNLWIAKSADWISEAGAQDGYVYVIVEPNESDKERSAVVEVSYGAKHSNDNFKALTVKQAAKNTDTPQPSETVELVYIDGEYYEPGYWDATYTNHNFYVMLATVDNVSTYQPNASYLQLDIWAASGDAANPVIPAGEYVFDTNDTCDAGTIGCYYSALVMTDASGNPSTEVYPVEGKVVVSDNKIEVNFVDVNGDAYAFVYNGTPALPVVVQESVEVNGTGYYATVSNYGDYYEVGANNYYFTLVEDGASFSGNYLTFDLLVDPSKADYTGEYTVLMDVSDVMGKFVPGNISGGYLNGSWYAVVENGSLTDVYQPLYGGTITIETNADGITTFTLDCVDDLGNAITGTVTANVEEVDPDAMALSANNNRGIAVRSKVIR
jgi:hypothetical protein